VNHAKPNKSELIIVSCSSIDNNKRVHLIPEILAGLKYPYKWYHFGGGNIELVKSKIKLLGIVEKCFLMGSVPHSNVIEFYKNNYVDLFINVSIAEGIPVSIMEAASFSVPLLATNVFGVSEIVNNKNGFLINVDFKPSEIALLLNNFFSNEKEIRNKRKNSYYTYLNHFNALVNYDKFILENIYNGII
jgi:glycosyltransferase involved in cell wall biosynthesis